MRQDAVCSIISDAIWMTMAAVLLQHAETDSDFLTNYGGMAMIQKLRIRHLCASLYQ